MSEGQAGTETRRTFTIYVCPECGSTDLERSRCRVEEPLHDRRRAEVEVVEASDPEGTAREGLITALRTELARQGEVAGQQQAAGYEKGWTEGRAYEAQMQSNSRASGGTRPAFTDEDDEVLYRVEVEGGGSFLYDEVDVGRFARRMAAEGDTRAFSVLSAVAGEGKQ